MEINIEFKGIPLRVVGEYEAGEERTYYDGDLGGCPGMNSWFSVEEVFAEDSEIKFSKYQDALELSTARANNVIRELIKHKIPSERLYSTGFGSSKSFQMTEKRVVEFEFKTMKPIQKDELDVESIFNKLKE